jgi:hypothetical protein
MQVLSGILSTAAPPRRKIRLVTANTSLVSGESRMMAWNTVIAILGLWALYSFVRGTWALCSPRSAWKWERGAEFKNAEPSMVGLVMQIMRGLRRILVAALLTASAYAVYQFAYGTVWTVPAP